MADSGGAVAETCQSVRKFRSKWDLKQDAPFPLENGLANPCSGNASLAGNDNGEKISASPKSPSVSSQQERWSRVEPSPRGRAFHRADGVAEDDARGSRELSRWDEGDGYERKMSPGLDGWRHQSSRHSPRKESKRRRRSTSSSRSRSPKHGSRGESGAYDRSKSSSGCGRLCKDFAAGSCWKGRHCEFLHQGAHHHDDDDRENDRRFTSSRYSSSARCEKSSVLCKDFLKGSCRRGASCKFTHDDAYGASDRPNSVPAERQADRRNRDADRDWHGLHGAADIPCRFFAVGKCRNGRYCRFSHGDQDHRNHGQRSQDDRWSRSQDTEEAHKWSDPKWGNMNISSNEAPSGGGGGGACPRRDDASLSREKADKVQSDERWESFTTGAEHKWSDEKWASANAAAADVNASASGAAWGKLGSKSDGLRVSLGNGSAVGIEMGGLADGKIRGEDGGGGGGDGESGAAVEDARVQVESKEAPVRERGGENWFGDMEMSPDWNPVAKSSSSQPHHADSRQRQLAAPSSSMVKNELDQLGAASSGACVLQNVTVAGSQTQLPFQEHGAFRLPFQAADGVAAGERLTQLSTLSASLAQLLANGQQLPQLYATHNSSALAAAAKPDYIMTEEPEEPAGPSLAKQEPFPAINGGFLPVLPGSAQQRDEEDDGRLGSTLPAPLSAASAEKKADERSKNESGLNSKDANGDGSGGDGLKSNEARAAIRAFKFALVEFVKELLKPTWRDGHLSKDAYKNIVKKVVDKVTSSVQGAVPQTDEKIEHYLSYSKAKLMKLVQAYVEKNQRGYV